MTITSLSNATVKLLASLRMEKFRAEHDLFLIEGARTALDALKAGAVPKILAYQAAAADAAVVDTLSSACRKAGGTCIAVNTEVMGKITNKDNPQSIAAAYTIQYRAFDELRPTSGDLFLALDRVRDPGNLGAIIRTTDAVGASGILLIGASCDPYAVECVRATTGSIFRVPAYSGSQEQFVALAQRWPGAVIGTSATGSDHYRKINLKTPVLAVLGTEQSGMSNAVERACQKVVHIPMYGGAESLNIAVAAGVLLYGIRETLA
ncbi:MAG: RNA methyltransferase [Rhodospirillaceae bacterium]|nr:RNA methyltransferase [Rhodospirillaceae bacterium]